MNDQSTLDASIKVAVKQAERLCELRRLVAEVMEWHADPDSADYNECDEVPCEWCSDARRMLEG